MALVSDPSLDAPVFHLPYGMRYDCLRDGICCHEWDIPVEAEDAARILTANWSSCSGLATGTSPFARNNHGQDMVRRVGEACNFLGPDNICKLHEAFGLEIKPLACQRFPFRFVEAPDGVYVGLSFVCPSIVKNTGIPIEEQFDQVRKSFILHPSAHKLADPVRFDASSPIEWEDYLSIEQVLDEILGRADYPLESCLIAGHVWLGILRQMLHSREMPPGLTASQIVRFYINKTRSEGLARCFEIAMRPVANKALKRMLLGSFMSFRTSLVEGRGRMVVMGDILLQNMRHWLRMGMVQVPPFQKSFSYRDFEVDKVSLQSTEMQSMLRRYFRHTLFRKDLIRHTDLFWGYCFQVLTYGLTQWYAAALRTMAPSDFDPTQALSMVERYYVHHTNFDQLFLYHPALGEVFQYIFKKPNFAHSIING